MAARDQDVGVTRAQKEALERPQPTRRTDEETAPFEVPSARREALIAGSQLQTIEKANVFKFY